LVSYVVVNFGFPPFLEACLRSLLHEGAELILVDNGSAPEHLAQVRALLHRLMGHDRALLCHDDRGSYGSGVNAGLLRASGEICVALNTDVVVGRGLTALLQQQRHAEPAMYCVPVYDWDWPADERTRRMQAECVGLTIYGSCLPVTSQSLRRSFVLGPAGPVVVMNRAFVRAAMDRWDFVYDPKFRLYGEDVDLYLRSAREGWPSHILSCFYDKGEHIWHIGSGNTSGAGASSMKKRPEMAAMILAGMAENIRTHSGRLERGLLACLSLGFRGLFLLSYWRANGAAALRQLLALLRRNWIDRRETLPPPEDPFFLLRRSALAWRYVLPWAKAR
jgi:GT2 family glycosyltransferase